MRTIGIQILCRLMAMVCLWAGSEAQAADPMPASGGEPAIARMKVELVDLGTGSHRLQGQAYMVSGPVTLSSKRNIGSPTSAAGLTRTF